MLWSVTMHDDDMVDTTTAIAIVGRSPSTFYRLLRENAFTRYRRNYTVLYSRQELEQYVDKRDTIRRIS